MKKILTVFIFITASSHAQGVAGRSYLGNLPRPLSAAKNTANTYAVGEVQINTTAFSFSQKDSIVQLHSGYHTIVAGNHQQQVIEKRMTAQKATSFESNVDKREVNTNQSENKVSTPVKEVNVNAEKAK